MNYFSIGCVFVLIIDRLTHEIWIKVTAKWQHFCLNLDNRLNKIGPIYPTILKVPSFSTSQQTCDDPQNFKTRPHLKTLPEVIVSEGIYQVIISQTAALNGLSVSVCSHRYRIIMSVCGIVVGNTSEPMNRSGKTVHIRQAYRKKKYIYYDTSQPFSCSNNFLSAGFGSLDTAEKEEEGEGDEEATVSADNILLNQIPKLGSRPDWHLSLIPGSQEKVQKHIIQVNQGS